MNRWLVILLASVALAACDDDDGDGGALPLPGQADQPAISLLPGDETLGPTLGTAPVCCSAAMKFVSAVCRFAWK